MSNTELFIELVNSVKSEMPNSKGKNKDEYYKELYNYYGIVFNPSAFGTKDVYDAIKKKINELLVTNDTDFINFQDLKNIKRQIIWEYTVLSKNMEPYFGVLSFLWDISRGIYRIIPLSYKNEWKSIIKLIKEYFLLKNWMADSHIYQYKLEDRANETGSALKYFLKSHDIKIDFIDGSILLTD